MDNLREALKGDWKKDKPAKYCFPPPEQEREMDAAEPIAQGEQILSLEMYNRLSFYTG